MSAIKFTHIASSYNEYLDSLYAYALHMGFDEQTSMDAIHDVFYKLCTRHTSLDEIENLTFYLFRSLRNRLIDLKRSGREMQGISTLDEEYDEILPFRLHVTVEDEFISHEDADEIRLKVEQFLDQLTHREREIVYLRYIQECSYEEISGLMEISVAASRNLVSKSIRKLRVASLTLTSLLLVIK